MAGKMIKKKKEAYFPPLKAWYLHQFFLVPKIWGGGGGGFMMGLSEAAGNVFLFF
jgi:hypothetical protein